MAGGGQFSAGFHAVRRLLKAHPDKVRKLFIDERSNNPRLEEIIQAAGALSVGIEKVRSFRLDDMSRGTAHQGVVAALKNLQHWDEAALRSKVESALQAGDAPVILVLDDIQDPHNLGACLRTADATGVMAVVSARRGGAGLTPAVRKVASGAAETVPVVAVRNVGRVLDWLREYKFSVIGTSDSATGDFWETDFRGPVAIVMGTESTGLSEAIAARCDRLLSLPMLGSVESLNVSVAAGVVLYEVARQRHG
ncbi:MAG: 23S rRNA (guanosine(2251)-2'-O)-methyltransferase RlmB [Pseudomonadota bacterium]